MPRETPDPSLKAMAIADLLDGQQPAVVAERYGLNAATVRSWKARLDLPVPSDDATGVATEGVGVATGVATVIRQPAIEAQQLALGDLVMENLRAKLIATQRIAEHVTQAAWLNNQTAADVAVLFEALDRSAVGILDRLAQRGRAEPDDDEGRGDRAAAAPAPAE